MATKKYDLNPITALLQNAGVEKTTKVRNVDIERTDGNIIAVPQRMTLPNAAEWLITKDKEESKLVAVHYDFPGWPTDGAVAFIKVISEVYGFAEQLAIPGFFGPQPPQMLTVKTGPGTSDFTQVPWGRLRFPGLTKDEYLQTDWRISDKGVPQFTVDGMIMKKNEPHIETLVAMVAAYLKEHSIYQGRALKVGLGWLRGADHFDPVGSAPEFMNLDAVRPDQLILNDDTYQAIRGNVFGFVEQTDAYIQNGESLNSGVLLAGAYGTGKTLTARILAKKAQDNGWTFLYLKDVQDIAAALRMAELYETSNRGVVIFAEDIDRVLTGERTSEIDEILNTISGVDGSHRKTLSVLTTNNPEAIHEAMLRAGRIDSFISFDYPDGPTALRFIRYYGGDLLVEDDDYTQLEQVVDRYPPAFLEATVRRARRYAISEHGADVSHKVTADMLINAAESYRHHVQIAAGSSKTVKPDAVAVLAEALASSDAFRKQIALEVWAEYRNI